VILHLSTVPKRLAPGARPVLRDRPPAGSSARRLSEL